MDIQTGIHTVADDNESFRSFRDGQGERSFEHIVRFERPFAAAPKILVTLSHLDVVSYTALRLNITAEKISASGFTLRYFTWANTQILGLGAQWMAFHEDPSPR
jgi:H-type lectin domain-containing protein